MDDPNQLTTPPDDSQDQQDDSELMFAIGQEVRIYFDEQIAILLAQIDARMAGQSEILNSIKELQSALTSVMLAPRMLILDENGTPIGVKTLLVMIELRAGRSRACAEKRAIPALVPFQPGATAGTGSPRWMSRRPFSPR